MERRPTNTKVIFSTVFLLVQCLLAAKATPPLNGNQLNPVQRNLLQDNPLLSSRKNPLLSWSASVVNKERTKRAPPGRLTILDEPKCSVLKSHCADEDDVNAMECLQNLNPSILKNLDDTCQHAIWTHMKKLISNENVNDLLLSTCRSSLQNTNCVVDSDPGSYLKCLVVNKEQLDNKDCSDLIERLENIAFSDFRFLSKFLSSCVADIENLKCGRLDHERFSNAETIVCLQNSFSNVSESCRSEVFKLSEVQSDNIKLDRQLYMACAEDQMRYCRKFPPGSGRVYKCLLQFRTDRLNDKCREHLLRRQKLIAEDFRVSKGLMKACKEDIKKSHCRKQTSDDKSIRLAQILLCLENIIKNGTKVDSDCELEMRDHRKMLMEDYRLSPEIVNGCSVEIRKYCNQMEVGGKTIHCLMAAARPEGEDKKIRPQCERVLESLIKETDAGEDWRVDPVLHEACYPVVNVACKDLQGGDARVMSCLMDNIGADHMTEDCEDALMQIQYFVARDFKLDPQLYRACREDAVRICRASSQWDDNQSMKPDIGPMILPCLYRSAYDSKRERQVTPKCLDQIHRVMRQRAISVELQPEIERACLHDLALFCFHKTKKREEMMCLQENLDKLEDDSCKDAIEEYTERQAEHADLNPYIMAHCKEVIHTLCASEQQHDEGDIMDCLISHKNDPLVKSKNKCRISIEHFQIISLKDFRFTYKFKMACKPYALRFCQSAKTKAAVVSCLSEKVTNDTIHGVKSDVQKECRQQLKAQLFQQRENIEYDPKLARACEVDIKLHCKDIEHGSAQVLECLQTVTDKLTESCQVEVFKIKKQELTDNSIDYALMTMCAESILQFCPNVEQSNVLECLKRNKDERGFNKKCRLVVIHRIIEQNSDYRLNPSLQDNCKLDIKKFCAETVIHAKPNKELNGEVIKCLKNAFKHSKLTTSCEHEMSGILQQQALDVQLNPLLRAVCRNELETICKQEVDGADHGGAEECLKMALLKKKIPTMACQVEVANIIEESQADINVDPLLQQVCSVDLLKFCHDIPQGNGRHVKCLKVIMDDNRAQLTRDCKDMLTKRLEMYRNAAELVPPADLQELYQQVVGSPSKHIFFMVILTILGVFFLLGTFCGRVSKRHMLIKNK